MPNGSKWLPGAREEKLVMANNKASGKLIPWRVITFSTEGSILSDE
jgi:hypothetical protein